MQAKSSLLYVSSFIAMGTIFAMDALLPPVIACGVPYAAVVLLSFWLPGKTSTLSLATAGGLLTLLGLAGTPLVDFHWTVLMNRGLALFIIASTASLIWMCKTQMQVQQQNQAELAQHKDHLEDLVKQRTAELADSQGKLRRSERLASIGTLAAGIAHEINNPLGLILLQVDAGCKDKNNPKSTERALRKIEQHVGRCAHIVKSVLRFAREEASEKLPQDLNAIVHRAEDLVRNLTESHGIALDLELEQGLPQIEANPTELEQVMVNVIHNAIHACRRGGAVSIRTTKDSDTVRAIVRDNGIGMSTEQLTHAFDPFYTTKFHQGGTGLGLSTCHGIVTQHGGQLAVESAQGSGTTVTIDLPFTPSLETSTSHAKRAHC